MVVSSLRAEPVYRFSSKTHNPDTWLGGVFYPVKNKISLDVLSAPGELIFENAVTIRVYQRGTILWADVIAKDLGFFQLHGVEAPVIFGFPLQPGKWETIELECYNYSKQAFLRVLVGGKVLCDKPISLRNPLNVTITKLTTSNELQTSQF